MTTDLTASPTATPPEPRPTAGMTTKVVKGSLWTLAGQVAPLGITMFTTPFVIRLLGSQSYGVLILVALIPSYLGFADFGMNIASTKFASAAYANGDARKEAGIVRTAALIAFCASIPFAIAMFVLSDLLITIFNVPEQLHGTASLALKFASITLLTNFLNGILNTPQLTRLRMDLNTLVSSGFRILGIIATPIVIYFGGGIVGAVLVLMTASLLTLAAHVIVSGNLNPYLFEFSVEKSDLWPLMRFGFALVGAGIAAVLLVNAEKGILANTISTTALAYYTIAFTLASMLTMFSSAMIQSLLPAFSQLQKEDKRDQLTSLFSRGIRMNLLWLAPILVVICIVARPFFTIWAGEDFGRESVIPFYILSAGIVFNILAYFPYAAIMATGRSDIFAKLYWVELIVYVVLVWVLTTRFGIVGAAIAWSIRVFCDAIILFFLARKIAGLKYAPVGTRPFLLGVTVMVIPFILNLYFDALNAIVIVSTCLALIIYGSIAWTAILEKEEIAWLLAKINVKFS